MVEAMVAAATAPNVDREIINVGSGVETSVRELVDLILDLTGRRAEVIYNPRANPGVERMCADLSRAREKLGYQPRHSLAEGLRLTMERDPRFQMATAEHH